MPFFCASDEGSPAPRRSWTARLAAARDRTGLGDAESDPDRLLGAGSAPRMPDASVSAGTVL